MALPVFAKENAEALLNKVTPMPKHHTMKVWR
jgi:hypothetical protein